MHEAASSLRTRTPPSRVNVYSMSWQSPKEDVRLDLSIRDNGLALDSLALSSCPLDVCM